MPKKISSKAVQKLTVSLPIILVERLRALVPLHKRSLFIAEAVEERLALEEQIAAIETAAGIWKDENHPDMQTGEEIDRWLTKLRRS
jgi:hypothetical protein